MMIKYFRIIILLLISNINSFEYNLNNQLLYFYNTSNIDKDLIVININNENDDILNLNKQQYGSIFSGYWTNRNIFNYY